MGGVGGTESLTVTHNGSRADNMCTKEESQQSLEERMVTVPAIVLAGGECDGLLPFSATTPKALMKVGSKSLICGTLENLWSSGIRKIFIVTDMEDNDRIQSHVRSEFLDVVLSSNSNDSSGPDVTFCPIADTKTEEIGTTDVLRQFAQKINGDFLVLPCDLHGSFNFRELVEQHRSSTRLCTMALITADGDNKGTKKPKEKAADQDAPGGNKAMGWGYKYRAMATLDTLKSQIVGIADGICISSGESYEMPKWTLMRHPNCKIRFDVYDVHVYAFSSDIFKVAQLPEMSQTSIRLELIPYIIRMQETPASASWFCSVPIENYLDERSWSMKEFDDVFDYRRSRVFYYMGFGDSTQCARVNSIEALMERNMLCLTNKSNQKPTVAMDGSKQKIRDVIFAGDCDIGSAVNLRSCVFGSNVSVGSGCKLSKCILMDNVKLGDNVVLDTCVIGEDSTISTKATLKYVVVAPEQSVPQGIYLERDYFPPFISD